MSTRVVLIGIDGATFMLLDPLMEQGVMPGLREFIQGGVRAQLDSVVPLEPAAMPGRVVVQWDKEDCADMGIIKVDLLGLGMMAAIEECLSLIRGVLTLLPPHIKHPGFMCWSIALVAMIGIACSNSDIGESSTTSFAPSTASRLP